MHHSLALSLFLALIFCLSTNLLPSVSGNTEAPTVQLPGGVLRGKYLTSRDGNRYEAYLGIRFGKIPERFENSLVDTSTWEGVKDATEYTHACAQNYPGHVSEDCLFLNVFRPNGDTKNRPVVVYIHGGGFSTGGSSICRAKYFMDEDVILVTVTYRVGVMGFLTTGDGVVTGNMGLKDQVTSLKWVQQNIAAFGGDPYKVTIAGTSAGGSSVNFLLLAPLAKGLFHSAVAFSGAATNPWAFRENTLPYTDEIAEKVGCDTTANSEDLVACLRETSAKKLLEAQGALTKWHTDPLAPFPPTIELKNDRNPEPFIDRHPIEILKSGDFNRVPVVLTVMKDEGIILHSGVVLRNEALRKQLNEEWNRVAPITFLYGDVPGFSGHVNEISEEIRQFYFENAEITLENAQNLTDLYTDSWFLKGIHDTALLLAKYTPVYTGLYTHQRKDYSLASFFGITEILGVSHGDDIAMLFDSAEAFAELNPAFVLLDVTEEDDVKVSKAFVKLVTSLAASGTPKWDLGNSAVWTPVTKNEIKTGALNWLNIGLDPFLHINPFKSRMDFWGNIYRKQSKKSTKTEL